MRITPLPLLPRPPASASNRAAPEESHGDGDPSGTDPESNLTDEGDDGLFASFNTDTADDVDLEAQLRFPAPRGFGDLAHSAFEATILDSASTFVQRIVGAYYDASATPAYSIPRNGSGRGRTPFVDPADCLDNEGQRIALCVVLDFLESLHQFVSTSAAGVPAPPPPPLRILLLGVAGTGKSFVLRILQSFVFIYAPDPRAFLIVAPTGASGAALGAPTADRALHFDRTSKDPKPLSPEDLAVFQNRFRALLAAAGDEISMWGQCMFGNFAERCNDLFNGGRCQDISLEFAIHPFGIYPLSPVDFFN
jgi:hypothetical protein